MMEVVKNPDSDQNQSFVDLGNEYSEMLQQMCCVYRRDHEITKDAVNV